VDDLEEVNLPIIE